MTDKSSSNPDFTEYNWSEKIKSVILSSFFWGFTVTQIPGGYLADRFGGKAIILNSVLISSILTMLTPPFAEIDWKLLLLNRFIQGVSQGATFPAVHTVFSRWILVEERTVLGTVCYSGGVFGIVVVLATSGILASSPLGWPSTFYLPGIVGVIWSVLWYKWGASGPEEYKAISVEEMQKIRTSLGPNTQSKGHKLNAPWLKILTSVPFLALTTTQCTNSWGFWTLATQIPSYMKSVLGMNIKENALLSSLPYLAMLLLSFVFAAIAAMLRKWKCMPPSVSRKLFNTISQWIPGASLVCLGYVNSSQAMLAVALLTIAIGLNAAMFLGFAMNHIDLSPHYAGILMGISGFASSIMGVMAPLVVGFVVTDVSNVDQWRIIFFISAGLFFAGNLLFVIFGTTETQAWNDIPQNVTNVRN